MQALKTMMFRVVNALGAPGLPVGKKDVEDFRWSRNRVVQGALWRAALRCADAVLRHSNHISNPAHTCRRLYLAAHYTALASVSRQAGLKELCARQLTSALRYVGIIPADRVGAFLWLFLMLCAPVMGNTSRQGARHAHARAHTHTHTHTHTIVVLLPLAQRRGGVSMHDGYRSLCWCISGHICTWLCAQAFYEAGLAWRDAGRHSMAFVMLNRYLDLSDAMDEPDSSAAVSWLAVS